MAAGTSAIFVSTPLCPQVRISVANTGRDGSGTLGTVYTAGANGAFFKAVRVQPEAAIPFGDVVRLFKQSLGSGNNELVAELQIPQSNPAASGAGAPPVAIPAVMWDNNGLGITLAGTDVFLASTDQGKTYRVSLENGGSY